MYLTFVCLFNEELTEIKLDVYNMYPFILRLSKGLAFINHPCPESLSLTCCCSNIVI